MQVPLDIFLSWKIGLHRDHVFIAHQLSHTSLAFSLKWQRWTETVMDGNEMEKRCQRIRNYIVAD